ncbi:MAG: sulfotransferase [Chthoniobacteraceae bacterium]
MADFPKPSFIIGGAPRCGTTWLCHALERHPEVALAKPLIPEPKVFLAPECDETLLARRYTALFAGASPAATILGEKTSYYLENEAAFERIRRFLPDLKLVFLLREPVARAFSNWQWSRQNGIETLGFEEAIASEGTRPDPFPPEMAYVRPFDYLTRGHYDRFAERWLSGFPKSSLFFALYEDLIDTPAAVMQRLCPFLGIAPGDFDYSSVGVINPANKDTAPLAAEIANRLRDRLRPSVTRFAELTGLDVARWGY